MKKITLLLACIAFSFNAYTQNTCATAQSVVVGTTTVAAVDGTEIPLPECAENEGGPRTAGEWFSYTATGDGVVNITTNLAANTGGDTRLHVYTGTCGTLACLAGNDDVDGTTYLSDVSFAVETGMTYIFAFDDRWSAAGFDFQLTFTPVTCTYSVPYTETYDDNNQFSVCYDTEDIDGDGISWISQQNLDLDGDTVPETFATNGNSAGPKDDWLFSPALTLVGGTSYTATTIFNTFSGNGSFEAFIVDAPNSGATQVATLFSNTNIAPQGAFAELETMAYVETNDFTPTTSGTFHIAYHSFGAASSGFILLFDSNLDVTLSTNEFESNTITHFYNSNTNSLDIKSSNLAFSNILVYDILGKQVLNRKLNSTEESINLGTIQEGVYITKISTLSGTKTIKFVKN